MQELAFFKLNEFHQLISEDLSQLGDWDATHLSAEGTQVMLVIISNGIKRMLTLKYRLNPSVLEASRRVVVRIS
jgi:hypothetical protein